MRTVNLAVVVACTLLGSISASAPAIAENDGRPDNREQYKCGLAGRAHVADARAADDRVQHTLLRTALTVDGDCYAEAKSIVTLPGFGYVFSRYVVNAYTMTKVAYTGNSTPTSAALTNCFIRIGTKRKENCSWADYVKFANELFGD
ncbi:MAG: hypothetical protein NTV97_09360 [Alphaproteobacteria bacterium]|nr:hypothetical protein [Alphaproteobacteria bacterium]